jgi:peptidyl-prolyl cis-trans isomerase SurA
MMKLATFHRAALMLGGTLAAAAALAQTGTAPAARQGGLDIPQNPRFLATTNSNIRKATALVNGVVITGTDIDHRLALIRVANGGQIPPEEEPRLREQILRNLIDETLQVQAAEAEDIKIEQREIDQYYARWAQSQKRSAQELSAYLRAAGSSEASMKRQIHAELAWSRLQRRQIEPFVSVSEEEVQAVIERLNAARGSQEYRVSEIFISATPETAAEARANAQRIVQQLRAGASFAAYARQFSEASTAAVGGDLEYVRAEQLPDPLSQAVQQIPVGAISDPIAVPGGFSIIAVTDTRQVLTADPRDAVLSLKQVTVNFTPGMPRAQVESRTQQLVRTAQSMGGCGRAEEAAAAIGAEVVSNDQVRVRELPAPLQQALLNLAVGQTTAPFGSPSERISVLVLCGRDDPAPASEVTFEAVHDQLAEDRINMKARRFLRDLRRDAVIDYRN